MRGITLTKSRGGFHYPFGRLKTLTNREGSRSRTLLHNIEQPHGEYLKGTECRSIMRRVLSQMLKRIQNGQFFRQVLAICKAYNKRKSCSWKRKALNNERLGFSPAVTPIDKFYHEVEIVGNLECLARCSGVLRSRSAPIRL